MFGFDKPEDGSEDRFHERMQNWKEGTPEKVSVVEPKVEETYSAPKIVRRIPLVQHYFWWMIHNLVAHPMIGLLPIKVSFRFHDWTSHKLNGL
jgi:hypothetical protein